MKATSLVRHPIALFLAVAVMCSSPVFAKLASRSSGPPTPDVKKAQPTFPILFENKNVLPMAINRDGSIPIRRNREKPVETMPALDALMLTGWTAQFGGTFTPASVKAVSPSIAWIAGNATFVSKTTDGGLTWTSVGAAPISGDIYNIDALNENVAFVTTSGTSTFIYRTTNGGGAWTTVYTLVGGFIDAIHMFDANNGIAVGDPVGGVWTIIKTTDGGATWNPISTPLPQVGAEAGWNNSMSVIGTTNIWFGTNSSKVYRSTDGGSTWTSGATSFGSSVSVSFVTANNGIVGGNPSGLDRTTDGGVTWASQTEPGSGSLSGMASAGTRDFWLVQGGTVYHSRDRGSSWAAEYTPTPATTWADISFETDGDSTSGWAVGSSSTIGAYRDAVSPPPPANDIRPSLVVDPANGSKRRANFNPQGRFMNAGSASQSNIPVRFEILNIGGTVIYANTSSIAGPLLPEQEATVTFSTFTIPGTPGYYTARAISANSDAIPSNDTLTVSFYVPTQLSGTYTVGTGGQFTTLKAVADTLTHNDVAGPVTFSLITNGTYNEPPLRIDGVSYATTPQPVVIKPAPGVTARIFVSDVADIGYVFQITNSSNFTIDGSNTVGGTTRDLTVEPDTSLNLNTTTFDLQGVRNFTIKNANIKGYFGAGAATAITMAQTAVTNRNVTFDNLRIGRAFNDFYSLGGSAALKDTNIVVSNCQLGTFGSPTFQTALYVNNVDSFQFHDNVIDGVTISPFAGSRAIVGLYLDGATRSSIYNNKVRNVLNNVAGANAYPVVGLRVGGDGASSSNKVWNNMVWDIATSSSDTGATIEGIYMLKGINDEAYFNSVYLRGTTTTRLISAAFQMDSTTCTLKNNILYNGRTEGTGGRSIALYRNNSAGSSLTSNYNILYAPGTTTGKLAAVRTTDYADLASWNAATGQDANSRRGNPQFIDPNVDLHISTTIPTPVESGGTSIPGITTDIDGNLRGGTPDIGADEGTFIPALAADMAPLSINDPVAGLAKKAGVPFSPKATFGNVGLSNQTSIPVRFRIYLASNLVTPVYETTSSIASLAAGGTAQVTFGAATISTTGNYVAYAISELGADGNRNNDTLTLAFSVKNPLAGPYSIPSTDYPTLYAAATDLRSVGVSAGVTFQLTAPSYTLPTQLVIDSVAGAGPGATVTFKPAPGVSPTITGTGNFAMVLLNGADYIVFDGSNTVGGTTRDMTFSYVPPSTPAAVFYLLSNGTGAGCRNNVIKNCNITSDREQNTNPATSFGVAMGGSTLASLTGPSDGPDNDSNAVSNNYFYRLRIGVWLRGSVTNPNDFNSITGNLVGPASFGIDQIGRAGIVVQHQNTLNLTRNEVRFVGGDLANSPAATISDRVGIGLGSDSWPAAQTFVLNSTITKNLVHDIVDERGMSAVGMVVAAQYAVPSTLNLIANNMIYGVRSNSSTAGKQTVGIAISYSKGDRVVFNSVRLSGDLDPVGTTSATQSAVGIRVSATQAAILTLKDNIISVDVNSNISTLKHYDIVVPSAAYNWSTGGCNYNLYDVNASNTQMSVGGVGTTVPYTDRLTFTDWRTTFTPNQDVNSVAGDPLFVSATNLHISGGGSPASNAGLTIAGVTDDFDGDVRNVSTPDIGADEFGSSTVNINVSIATGWNMISNPVTNAVPGDSVRQIFPSSLNAYAFEYVPGVGYSQRFRMENRKGYWGKFPSATTNVITGTSLTRDTLNVVNGWNMVGSISNPVDTSTIISIPPGLRASNWFGYAAGYSPVTQLTPGKGFWIKANGAGKFVIANPPLSGPAKVQASGAGAEEALHSVTITDSKGASQTLYFGADRENAIPLALYDMPPAPPAGAFDARFETAEGGSMVRTHAMKVTEPVEFSVQIQSDAYPLTVTWKVNGGTASYEMTDGLGGKVFPAKQMSGEGSMKITNSGLTKFAVRLVGDGTLPTEYALSQNYPNPFNPTTNIKYALPVDSRVTVHIYNVLGQRVRTLINDNMAAGYHIAEWDGMGNGGQQLASGVYFLQLSAAGTNGKSFNEIRKLMMLK